MRTLCRAFDWSSAALGPVERWSVSLRSTVRTVLASRNPMFLWWGPDLVQLYNDAYRPSFGTHVQLLDMGLHGTVTPDQRAALARIDRSQRHLLGLVNDVLNYARLGSGRIEYRLETILVGEALTDVLSMIELQVAAQQLRVDVRLPAMKGGDEHPKVRADREKLDQILLNLLSNAVKFTPPRGSITIECSGATSGIAARVELRISDTGIGIPTDKLDAVFEPFVQVRTDYTRASGGTGLGLAISRDLARAMDGDIVATSTLGEGSTFTLTLPAV